MYELQYCIDATIFYKTEVKTVAEALEWVTQINAQEGVTANVFNSDFHQKLESEEQWGTGYFWLNVKTIVPEQ